jgi:hypothetical protein
MLAVVCCGIQKLGAKPSLVVRLWKLFIGWADGFGIKVLLTNVPLVRGLVCTKLTMQEEEEGLRLVASSFFPVPLHNSSSVLFACLPNIELIID